jgi:hypothetical protein
MKEDFLVGLEEQGEAEVFDDGEEDAEASVFFVTGADEEDLLAVASRVAALPGVPAAAFAVVSDGEAEEFGLGRRVALPLWSTVSTARGSPCRAHGTCRWSFRSTARAW